MWDFNWQRGYGYDADLNEMPTMGNGDTVALTCRFNNSMTNPNVRAALDERGLSEPVDVKLGDDTLDEMCLGAFGVVYPNPDS